MALEDNVDEDRVVRDARTGEVVMRFVSKEARDGFLGVLANMEAKTERNKEEGYICGNCAAYPCFRTPASDLVEKGDFFGQGEEGRAKEEGLRRAGLCFQQVRQCRQECDFYHQQETEDFWPRGICKKDNAKVVYEQECHIDEIKKSRL